MKKGEIVGGGLKASKTVNITSSMTTSEIQTLINNQPRYIGVGKSLTFQFADGTKMSVQTDRDLTEEEQRKVKYHLGTIKISDLSNLSDPEMGRSLIVSPLF